MLSLKKLKKRLHFARGDTASPLKFYGERAGREKNMFEKVKKKEKKLITKIRNRQK